MKQKTFPAESKYLDDVKAFVQEELDKVDCPMKTAFQLELVIEEIFVNIVNYSYNPAVGDAEVRCEVLEDPLQVVIQFLDGGKPFDPLAAADADTSREATLQREGGLGIFIMKKTMDEVDYTYENGKNILTIKKNLN